MIPLDHRSSSALRVFSRRTHARSRLICFPHAGGAAGGYRDWSLDAPWDVEVYAVQYPGRGDRFDEPAATDMESLLDDLVPALTGACTAGELASAVFFGHSMGAAVAYEAARRLAVTGRPPAALVVSGQPAPSRTRGGALHRATDGELLADLRRLGGTAQEVMGNSALLEALLPTIRSDYRLIETYRPLPGGTLGIPVTVLYADDDPEVTADEAAAWGEVTAGTCEVEVFTGGHFYLETRRATVLPCVFGAARAALPETAAWPCTP
ncbi:thioesterase II family protein [Streptomyces roseochromogenus]|uniref:Thioesterase n=1 Tax=Streptomyces roseochromogenus subsp. oscitans DS 12.976 TaxID=1352936 RepID=V6KNB9_STRRC|nr:alpha/beta fold hydrolase [Streptomyces roseochromogenus]EST32926.1 thioesterase [Streptomyces roseochromogenus subsp. oscitans DS 12.976]